ncbi:MAG: c-type cytochrome biogenesis protein CcmI [Alphaproteobacteria bacterium]|nr:c-type cytochrome biogenesis protein CcmI [Alphaproteobacteria bacterium]
MTLIVVLGVMTVAAVAALAWPLLGRRGPAENRAAFDRAIYADQLAEIARDRDRGLIGAAEAEAARTEIERRALAALESDRRGTGSGRHSTGRALAAVLIVALPAAAGLAYVVFGAPGLPARPFAERPKAETPPALPSAEGIAAMIELIEARIKEAPDDARGWTLLIRLYQRLGRDGDAEATYRRAMDATAQRPDNAAAVALAYGETLLARADGTVTPAAKAAFDAALAAAPTDPAARYYRGLALLQGGDPKAALTLWQELERTAPADAPWREGLREKLEKLERELGAR